MGSGSHEVRRYEPTKPGRIARLHSLEHLTVLVLGVDNGVPIPQEQEEIGLDKIPQALDDPHDPAVAGALVDIDVKLPIQFKPASRVARPFQLVFEATKGAQIGRRDRIEGLGRGKLLEWQPGEEDLLEVKLGDANDPGSAMGLKFDQPFACEQS